MFFIYYPFYPIDDLKPCLVVTPIQFPSFFIIARSPKYILGRLEKKKHFVAEGWSEIQNISSPHLSHQLTPSSPIITILGSQKAQKGTRSASCPSRVARAVELALLRPSGEAQVIEMALIKGSRIL